ncbi:MAG: glutamate racemase [Planctomycetota bacterium]|nr:glutamate racemase [Planctomycetota bacterium]
MSSPTSPIIVLDSGLGGLTVVRALRQVLPFEDILYFGDTARVPYGPKSANTVTTFVREILAYLQPYDPKHVVFACNTATALALQTIRAQFPTLSISGVIDPGARAAVDAAAQHPRPLIGVIGTEATVRSGAYVRAILRLRQFAQVICHPTPLLVPIIEEGRSHQDPVVRLALQQYLLPLVSQHIDVLVLGCTHYPILKNLITEIVGPRVAVIDSADKCAQDVLRRLHSAKLQRDSRPITASLRCFVTDDPPRFASLASRFLGLRVDNPTLVSLDDLHSAAASTPNPAQSHLPCLGFVVRPSGRRIRPEVHPTNPNTIALPPNLPLRSAV